MKKGYTKPEIMFESFSLCTNIAAGCDEKTSLQGMDACGWIPDNKWTGGTIFISAPICETTPAGTGYDSLCYNVPSEDYNLFNS